MLLKLDFFFPPRLKRSFIIQKLLQHIEINLTCAVWF